MKITLNVYGIIIILIVFTGLFYLGGVKYRRQVNVLNTALYEATDSLKTYRVKIGSLERNVFEKEVIILSNDKYIKQIEQEKERLKALGIKNVLVIGEMKSTINVLNKKLSTVTSTKDTIMLTDTFTVLDANCLPLPLELKYEDKYSWANVSLTTEKSSEVSFGLNNVNFNFVIGNRGGIFKQRPTVITLDVENPYINVSDVKAIVIKEPKKWWNRKIIWAGAGFILAGIVL